MSKLDGSGRKCPVTGKFFVTYYRDGQYFSSRGQFRKWKKNKLDEKRKKYTAFMEELKKVEQAYVKTNTDRLEQVKEMEPLVEELVEKLD